MRTRRNRNKIIDLIEAERRRQDNKWGWPSSLGGSNLDRKNTILAEEVGEVAHAILEDDLDNMREELVQVAAVCVAWLESDAEQGWAIPRA